MRLLIDTHTLLWFIWGDTRLSLVARRSIEDANNEILISVASLWEVAIKLSAGRLDLTMPFPTFLDELEKRFEIALLPIEPSHLKEFVNLPFHHRDPFDRIIIAQAVSENMPLISIDAAFAPYPVSLLW